MSNEPLESSREASAGWNLPLLLVFALGALLLAVGAYWLGTRQAAGSGPQPAEVGFARDMITHHAQAVDLALLIRDRTEDEELRQVALDMLLTQQNQVGQMQGWLNTWQVPVASTDPPMAWMDMPVQGIMPGMATGEQINQLRSRTGIDADVLFLQLMIAHHQGGVTMAQGALDRASAPAVRALAQSIVNAQTYEIEVMQGFLARKGAAPVPEATPMPEGEHQMP